MTKASARSRLVSGGIPPELRARAVRGGVAQIDAGRCLLGLGPISTMPIGSLEDSGLWSAALETIAEAPEGPPPRLHAAIPFRPGDEAVGLLPAVQITGAPDGYWVTTVAVDDRGHRELLAMVDSISESPATPALPALVGLEQVPPAAGFEAMVEAALVEIGAGTIDKVVLSRSVRLDADAELDPLAVVDRMAEREPTCTLFSLPSGTWRFVGASPELLISRIGDRVRSLPLAGTVSRSADAQAGLLGSAKNVEEHRIVVDDIAQRVRPLLAELTVPDAPAIVTLRAVSHLGTQIEGRISSGGPSSVDLLAAIHPTPAIAGVPRSAALKAIAEFEGNGRGLFGGAIGWLDSTGDGEWVLGIRGAMIHDSEAVVRAGAGIVAGSQPHDEAVETRIKLLSILDAIAPGCAALL